MNSSQADAPSHTSDNKTNVAVTDIERPLKWKFTALNGTVGI